MDRNRRRGGYIGGASLWRRVAWSWIARWPTNFLGSASSSCFPFSSTDYTVNEPTCGECSQAFDTQSRGRRWLWTCHSFITACRHAASDLLTEKGRATEFRLQDAVQGVEHAFAGTRRTTAAAFGIVSHLCCLSLPRTRSDDIDDEVRQVSVRRRCGRTVGSVDGPVNPYGHAGTGIETRQHWLNAKVARTGGWQVTLSAIGPKQP